MSSDENVNWVSRGANPAAWWHWLRDEYWTRDAFPLLILIVPVVWLAAIDPASFSLVWFWGRQIGRAGFGFILFLVAWDWHNSRNKLTMTRARWRQGLALVILALVIVYYWERVLNVAWTDYLRIYITSRIGVSQESPLSFLLAADFLIYALFFVITAALLYSPSAAFLLITPIIYAVSSGVLDMMDAFFPENSLALLQVWVYLIWTVAISILGLLGFNTTIKSPYTQTPTPTVLLEGNHLYLWGFKGMITLALFWPSSGVVSMIVYGLVIVVLTAKLEAPLKRKTVYAVVGAAGAYLVNVCRIVLIVLYVTYVSPDAEAFHTSIGESLFICWVFVFMFLAIRIEAIKTALRPTRDIL